MAVAVQIEFNRYKRIIEKTLKQLSNEELNRVPCPEGNSVAVIVRHLSGNLKSRFTDFLTSDGEKPWRNREQEFADGPFEREELMQGWNEAWGILLNNLEELREEHLKSLVTIRGISLSVEDALNRSVAHVAYHAGQIVLIGRMFRREEWDWISIPKGKSDEYNMNPTLEKSPE